MNRVFDYDLIDVIFIGSPGFVKDDFMKFCTEHTSPKFNSKENGGGGNNNNNNSNSNSNNTNNTTNTTNTTNNNTSSSTTSSSSSSSSLQSLSFSDALLYHRSHILLVHTSSGHRHAIH